MGERNEMIRAFDGSDGSSVETWLRKIKLVVKLKGIKELHNFLPLYLEGAAFAVYDQLSDKDKEDGTKIEEALLSAFAEDQFSAYDNFRQRSWLAGEQVDVYLADLRRLARLAKIESDDLLRCAFICGLPSDVSAQLRATNNISKCDLATVSEQARIHMADRTRQGAFVVMKTTICANCGGRHPTQNCRRPRRSKVVCWTCGKEGHISRDCPGNDRGESYAPAAPHH